MTGETRSLLRSIPSLTGVAPPLNLDDVPDDPVALFLDWLEDARQREVAEPHAMTLSTVDSEGVPDARVLVLKDVGANGWAFASTRTSAKAIQLEASSQNTDAAKCGLQINWAAKIAEKYPKSTFVPKQRVGIDTSKLSAARTGIRGSNDLVWVGNAANNAAKLAALDPRCTTYHRRRLQQAE